MATPDRRSLADLAADSGLATVCAGNLPLDLSDRQFVWFIKTGAVDLFLLERREGVMQSAPQHLFRAGAGRLLPGVAPCGERALLGVVAKGSPGTVLQRLPVASLAVVSAAELAKHVDAWLVDFSAMLSRDVVTLPQPDMLVEPGQAAVTGGVLSARRGVVWVSGLPAGAALFTDLIDPAEDRTDDTGARSATPLTPATWLNLTKDLPLSVRSSETLAEENLLLPALSDFHRLALSLERLNRELAVVDQVNLERERAIQRWTDEEEARQRLFNLYGLPESEVVGEDRTALLKALKIVGQHEGIDFKWRARQGTHDSIPVLDDILDASGVRGRPVRLSPRDKWWLDDGVALLAFQEESGRPVALLPGAVGPYRMVDPVAQSTTRVTAETARSLRTSAWMFYRPLPTASAGLRDLFQIGSKGLAANFALLVAAGMLGGLVMLLPAAVLGFIADKVISSGEAGLLYPAAATLLALALLGTLLCVQQETTLMRLEGTVLFRIEAAFWDRLLRLPPSFLKRYAAGDLAMRGLTFQTLRDAAHGVFSNAVLSIIFLLPVFFLIFCYDVVLGGAASAFGLLSLLVTVMLGLRQVSPHGRRVRSTHRLAGGLLQFINGITKLRIAGAQGSAFAVWARDYRELKVAELALGAREAHSQAFGAVLPLLASAVLFLAATLPNREAIPVGDFLVVYTMFMVFQAAVMRLSGSFSELAVIMPTLDQIRPFLVEQTDANLDGEPVGILGGEVMFDHVSFRYAPEGPAILDDVSIHVRPGEFVAIAGESGAGKSTLFRLALGLDQPTAGVVSYDGRDLKHLNLAQVRRQIGTVPQEVQLHPEDLWDNILGDREDATAEDARRATRLAAVERDIAAMPMGMLTNVGISDSLISGGEAQRIVIARALLRNPRILLLDEATNWLDNDTQAEVMDNLAGLSSTRIVIAHRLSTLRQADRIYVLRAGKVVQVGSFDELAMVEGVFQDLVRRQMA